MVKLNLLPEKIKAAERLRFVFLVGAVVYILGLGALSWVWVGKKASLSAAQAKVDAVKAELESPQLNSTVKAVEKFTQDQDEMNSKASVVNAVRKRQATIAKLMDALPDWTLGGSVWFNTFDVSDVRKVNLEGMAPAGLAFAKFYTQIETQPGISGLKLESVSSYTEKGRDVSKFKVSFQMEEFQ